jgi:hypothetical protein
MAVSEFGSEEQIKEKLEYIISSEVYQRAAKEVQVMSQDPVVINPSLLSATSSSGLHINASYLLKRKSFLCAMNNLQSIPVDFNLLPR